MYGSVIIVRNSMRWQTRQNEWNATDDQSSLFLPQVSAMLLESRNQCRHTLFTQKSWQCVSTSRLSRVCTMALLSSAGQGPSAVRDHDNSQASNGDPFAYLQIFVEFLLLALGYFSQRKHLF